MGGNDCYRSYIRLAKGMRQRTQAHVNKMQRIIFLWRRWRIWEWTELWFHGIERCLPKTPCVKKMDDYGNYRFCPPSLLWWTICLSSWEISWVVLAKWLSVSAMVPNRRTFMPSFSEALVHVGLIGCSCQVLYSFAREPSKFLQARWCLIAVGYWLSVFWYCWLAAARLALQQDSCSHRFPWL